jgi:Ca2+-transporting ATPase
VLRNGWLLGGLAASIVLQLLVLYVPWLNGLFHTLPPDPGTLLLLVALASSVLWVEELRKLLARRGGRTAP